MASPTLPGAVSAVSSVVLPLRSLLALIVDLALVLLVLSAVLRIAAPKLYALFSIPTPSATELAYLCGAWYLASKR